MRLVGESFGEHGTFAFRCDEVYTGYVVRQSRSMIISPSREADEEHATGINM